MSKTYKIILHDGDSHELNDQEFKKFRDWYFEARGPKVVDFHRTGQPLLSINKLDVKRWKEVEFGSLDITMVKCDYGNQHAVGSACHCDKEFSGMSGRVVWKVYQELRPGIIYASEVTPELQQQAKVYIQEHLQYCEYGSPHIKEQCACRSLYHGKDPHEVLLVVQTMNPQRASITDLSWAEKQFAWSKLRISKHITI